MTKKLMTTRKDSTVLLYNSSLVLFYSCIFFLIAYSWYWVKEWVCFIPLPLSVNLQMAESQYLSKRHLSLLLHGNEFSLYWSLGRFSTHFQEVERSPVRRNFTIKDVTLVIFWNCSFATMSQPFTLIMYGSEFGWKAFKESTIF